MKSKLMLVGALMLLLALVLAACQADTAPTQAPVVDQDQDQEQVCPTAAPCPDCPTCPPGQPTSVVQEVPFEEQWAGSPHNTADAEAFVHWNEDDPAEVPSNCARCHSTPGYVEFVTTGENTSNFPAPAGTIQCVACHNEATDTMSEVAFPYMITPEEGGDPVNVTVTGLGPEARCMVCHQGRASKSQVDDALARYGITEDLDTVPAPVEERPLGFINIHYYPAAATLYGTMVKGGYEYAGKSYDAKFDHVEGYDSCVGCHNPHTLEIKLEECAACHEGVASEEDLRNIRMAGSLVDFDGDGDMEEGIPGEIEGLQAVLLQNIQAYANEVAGTAIAYTPASHPYWFTDPNADGTLSDDEINSDNSYGTWTGRLLKAAYNYQMSVKDPGNFAHGGKYTIQLLYDSIEDLNQAVANPVDMSTLARIDNGHFAGSEEAFRHWDAEGGVVPGTCARCHSATGLPVFMANATNVAEPSSNGLNCATCHSDLSTFTLYEVNQVTFPSGATVSFGEGSTANICMQCHQGRESKVSVDRAISAAGGGADQASESLRFRNPHYFATAATLWGTEVQGAYEFDGQDYNGRFMHVQGFRTCTECHDSHVLKVKIDACTACHAMADEGLENIRISEVDFDGDGDSAEGLALEIDSFEERLLAALQAYTTSYNLPMIGYDAHVYPYFFEDADGNGELNGEEAAYANWTPNLLRSAYNYQWSQKDPGTFAHNGHYILQILYDSIDSIGGDVRDLERPEVRVPAEQ